MLSMGPRRSNTLSELHWDMWNGEKEKKGNIRAPVMGTGLLSLAPSDWSYVGDNYSTTGAPEAP
jgi:hypothetical protein